MINKALLSLAGLSVGDGFGQSLYGPETKNLILNRELPAAPWYWTDDTQMAISVVEELKLRDWIDQDYLARRMAWRYNTDSGRGYGPGTRRTLERIANGEYFRSVAGLFPNGGSFGSGGPARSIPIGGFYDGSPSKAAREARLVSAITHLHPEGLAGSEAVAAAASIAAKDNHFTGTAFLKEVSRFVSNSQVRDGILRAINIPPNELQKAILELGTDNPFTVMSTVPFALWCAAHHLNDFEGALWSAASGLNPRDTICAMVGGIVALSCERIPQEWLKRCEPLPDSLPSVYQENINPPHVSTLETDDTGSQTSVNFDSLTGTPNLLNLLNWANNLYNTKTEVPFSLISFQLIPLWEINKLFGRTAGDEMLLHTGKLLSDLSSCPVYRTGGDRFVVVVNDPARALTLAQTLSKATIIPDRKPSRAAVIHFFETKTATPGHVLACLYAAMGDRHFKENDGSPREFSADAIRLMDDYPWAARDLADQILNLGKAVREAVELSQTDSISQLPNMRAAQNALETLLNNARKRGEPLALLLIDGDNLRRYNEVSYEAGDKAIWLLGNTMKEMLRESDFIARWRTGDEFLILLPNTDKEGALQIGQRLCASVELASADWLFRSSISVGISLYPDHGPTMQDLLHAAEQGMDAAKSHGKSQALIAQSELNKPKGYSPDQERIPNS
jgi:diguanylate cyclase (GGDEF)-like protein